MFSKGHNSTIGDYSEKKKNGSAIFLCGIHICNLKTLAFTVQKLQYAIKNVTDTQTHARTSQSWGHKKSWGAGDKDGIEPTALSG